jgi:hypothetical protein
MWSWIVSFDHADAAGLSGLHYRPPNFPEHAPCFINIEDCSSLKVKHFSRAAAVRGSAELRQLLRQPEPAKTSARDFEGESTMRYTKQSLPLVICSFIFACATRQAPPDFPVDSPASTEVSPGLVLFPVELGSDAQGERGSTSGMPAEPHVHHAHQHHDPGGVTTSPDAEADVYVCPMHPEVTASEPGRCSKCGMNLEKKK